MKKLVIQLLIVSTLIFGLTGCGNKDIASIKEESQETISSETAETDNNNENKKDKEDKTESTLNNSETISGLVDDSSDGGATTDDNEELKEQLEYSGIVVETDLDFSIYQFDENTDNNEMTMYDIDNNKFMYELNMRVIELHSIYLLNINDYVDDATFYDKNKYDVEYAIEEAQYIIERIDTDNSIMNHKFSEDTDLINKWNTYYKVVSGMVDEINTLSKDNTKIDLGELQSSTASLSKALSSRLVGYDYYENSSIIEPEESSVDEVQN